MTNLETIERAHVVVKIDYLPSVNYALMNSGAEVCNSLVVENTGDEDWHQVTIRITGPYIKEDSCRLELLKSEQAVQITTLKIEPEVSVLNETTEAVQTTFTLSMDSQEGELYEKEYPITLLSFDEWAGNSVMPEHIAAFVVPNHPVLTKVHLAAAKFLERWTGSSAFDEYQTQDRNRVRAQVAAIYEALRSEGIIYSAPPASFEETGQRVRLADKVLTEKMGTCLDTSLLIASCLESVGIYPIILLLRGHAMVGAWLTPNVFSQMICDDASYLLKETADGNNNVVLLESTLITSSGSVSFEDAVESAMKKLGDESQFLYFVDVHRCRLGNIRPLPQRVMKDGAWVIVNEGIKHDNATESVNNLSHYDLRLEDTGKPTTKQMIWERKLLDFSLRNNLLNTRLGRKVVPFISFELEHLEDHLQNNEDYTVTPSPGKKIEPNADGMYDSKQQASEYQTFVSEMIGDHKIASYMTEAELQNALKYIYRTSRTSLEENGANSLFLTLGMLKWYETAKSEQPRYAPILLLPVDIIRKNGNNYVIRKRDEDIILNITLVELLKQNFSINLDVLHELPKDESGVDVKLIFTYFRRAIAEQKKWNVIEESMLGLFSFNKFVMWNDIHSNADKLKENVIVASLIDNQDKQADTNAIDARDIDKKSLPQDFAIPLDVDSSQMEAIVESGRGKSFILHGPPGTGKSQTITNMIANALYQGKRVLFVAEKMAALSVVQSRLEKINLAPFCLELHSNKATKKHFLEQMDEVLKVTKIKSPEDYAQKSEELFKERQELIGFMEAMHQKSSSGLSLYECISEYLAITEEEYNGQLPPKERLNVEYIAQLKELAGEMQAILDIVGQPSQHPLEGLEPKDNRQDTLDDIRTLLLDMKTANKQYANLISTLNNTLPLGVKNDADVQWLAMFADYVALEQKREDLRDDILASYSKEALRMDVNSCRREWEDVQAKWFLPRYFAKKNFLQSLQTYGQVFESGIDDMLNLVEDYQRAGKDMKVLTEDMEQFAHSHGFRHDDRLGIYQDHVDVQDSARRKAFLRDADAVLDANEELTSLTKKLHALTWQEMAKDDIIGRADRWLDHYDKMKDWYHWVAQKQKTIQLDAYPIVNMVEDGLSPQEAVDAFLKSIYHQLINKAIDEREELRMFNGLKFRQQIDKYKRDTARFQELSKEELYSRLASKVPSAYTATAEVSEISILKRNIANGGRGNSIRSIMDNIPTLLPRLCPCMLMSPISVAQYIDLNAEKFDLVIFDEASQMPTSEAVGAIARGKALVCVGDSKQMPPTSFFTTTQTDEEEADIDDMESILDDCITLSLCEHQLKWHYRSKHESLIAFSNSQYYDNSLLTFPSADDHQAKITLIPVSGVYDKGRTRSNKEESKAIVDEIVRRLSDEELRKYSIGVVAFSKVQGDLIEDDLTAVLDKNPDLKEIAYNGKEPIFIKNLENVQGDERDIILFSIGYGADKSGKVSMNFGPLNNNGGERRLNVAVSRARYEMMVFSTLKSSQIDLKRSQAKGVEGLKRFLEFAETSKLPMVPGTSHNTEQNVIVNQICNALARKGYITDSFVGRSDFKVDIAVSTAEHPEKYILGILCDGKSYYDTKTTRDREIVQPSVLKMLNWRVMRVYSIDWYENRERTLAQILDELKAIETGQVEDEPKEDLTAYVFNEDKIKESEVIDDPTRNQALRPYKEYDREVTGIDKDAFNPYDKKCAEVIKDIVKTEEPITESYLCKRVAKVLGFGHAGPNVQRAVSFALSNLYQDPLSIGDTDSFWLNEDHARDYDNYRAPSPRSITEIPAVEIANAVKEVIDEEFSLPKDKIPSIAARKLGFSSTGAKINEVINKVLDVLERASVVKVNNGLVSFIMLALFCLTATVVQAEQVVVETKNTSLVLDVEKDQQPKYVYYGAKLSTQELQHLQKPTQMGRMEAYPTYGLNTPAEAAFAMKHVDGNLSTALVTERYEQRENAGEGNVVTSITMKDPIYPITVNLNYKAYFNEDMIEVWTEITNNEKGTVNLTTFASAMLPIRRGDVWLSHFYGSWANEAQLVEEPLTPGQKVIVNKDGTRNSHTDHGEVMFSLDGKGQENMGQVIGAAICYSGNYRLKVVTDDTEYHYFFAGINEDNSEYHLKKGETFKTPALALTYSCQGLSGVSRNFHKWGRKYKLMHGDKERKILLNSWEGVYFDINQQGMDQMMADIASMGGELFVMDDGWFGDKYPRKVDNSSLGDWVVDKNKLPDGIEGLLRDARKNGVKFGIWIEPEMANTTSELYEAHPDWIVKAPKREPVLGRGGTQVVLDLSNPKVQDFVFGIVDNLMSKYPEIDYIKWDANMPIMNHGSQYLTMTDQSHLYIDYHRGFEKVCQRIREKFPDVTIQACASGGGRANWGVLPWFDEFWVSDNTDALQRIYMQWGTSYFFPAIAMASHISATPNHTVFRTTSMKYRIDVAMSGRLGMEIQPKNMTDEEKALCRQAIKEYKQIRPIVQFGNIYRLVSPYDRKGLASMMYVNDEQTKAVWYWWKTESFQNEHLPRVKMAGLNPDRMYKVHELNRIDLQPLDCEGKTYSGAYLMSHGLDVPYRNEVEWSKKNDWASRVLLLEAF